MSTIIAIPSYKRSQWMLECGGALENISRDYMDSTYLVVRGEEVDAYLPVAKKYGCRICPIPHGEIERYPEYGIRETRDYIFDSFLGVCSHLLVMEDDQRIDGRGTEPGHYRRMVDKETEWPELMHLLETADMFIPVTSPLQRLFCISKAGKESLIGGDAIQTTLYYSPFFLAHPDYRYAFGPKYMEDWYFLIRLMTEGYGVRIFCQFVKQDVLNMKRTVDFGGCNAAGRKMEEVNECAKTIAKKWPDYVEAYWKTKESTWGSEPVIGLKTKWSQLGALYKGPRE